MWDQRYSESGFAYGTSPNDFLVESSGDLIVGRTLCVAEGEGRNAVYLAGLGHNVTAVDQSLVGLKKAERLATDHGVVLTTVRSDLADYEIPTESFDCIVSIWCHVPRALRALLHQKFVSGLRPGGHLVLEAYTENQLGRGT
jgi:SAM-dependent methyltransferase